jgi:hypothetical protein
VTTGDHEPATRAIYWNHRARVRLVGKAIERIPLNDAARDAITRMLKRADELGHTNPEHYLWCAS